MGLSIVKKEFLEKKVPEVIIFLFISPKSPSKMLKHVI